MYSGVHSEYTVLVVRKTAFTLQLYSVYREYSFTGLTSRQQEQRAQVGAVCTGYGESEVTGVLGKNEVEEESHSQYTAVSNATRYQ